LVAAPTAEGKKREMGSGSSQPTYLRIGDADLPGEGEGGRKGRM